MILTVLMESGSGKNSDCDSPILRSNLNVISVEILEVEASAFLIEDPPGTIPLGNCGPLGHRHIHQIKAIAPISPRAISPLVLDSLGATGQFKGNLVCQLVIRAGTRRGNGITSSPSIPRSHNRPVIVL